MSEPVAVPKPLDPLIGTTLAGRYLVLDLIDRGGMGKIFRAEQQPLGHIVAIKTLDVHDSTGEFKKRFFIEAATSAKLAHPNTVRVYDFGETEGGHSCFLAMEFLRGRQLHQAIRSDARMPALRAIRIVRQVCGALQEAHEAGIIHRDVKPQNIFLTEHGDDPDFVKVVDFGLAKDLASDSEVSKSGNVLGSPMYMAPEQVEAKPIGAYTDVYALGLVLYAMLAGHPPFKRGDSLTIMMQQVHKDPAPFSEACPDANVPENLEWVVRTATQKDPAQRFQTMRAFSQALKVVEGQLRGELPMTALRLEQGQIVGVTADLGEVGKAADASVRRAPDSMGSGVRPAPVDSAQTSFSGTMTRPSSIAIGVASMGVVGAIALGGVFLVVLGIAAFVLTRPTVAVAVPPVAPVTAPVVAAPAAPTAPAEPAAVSVRIESEPSGADVTEDGVMVGNTPFDVRVVAEAPRTLAIAAPGHVPKSVRVDGANASLIVRLEPVVRPAAASKVPAVVAPTSPQVTPAVVAPPPVRTPSTVAPGGDLKDPFAP